MTSGSAIGQHSNRVCLSCIITSGHILNVLVFNAKHNKCLSVSAGIVSSPFTSAAWLLLPQCPEITEIRPYLLSVLPNQCSDVLFSSFLLPSSFIPSSGMLLLSVCGLTFWVMIRKRLLSQFPCSTLWSVVFI